MDFSLTISFFLKILESPYILEGLDSLISNLGI